MKEQSTSPKMKNSSNEQQPESSELSAAKGTYSIVDDNVAFRVIKREQEGLPDRYCLTINNKIVKQFDTVEEAINFRESKDWMLIIILVEEIIKFYNQSNTQK